MRKAVSVQMQLKSELDMQASAIVSLTRSREVATHMLEQLLAATAEVRQLVAQVERPLGRATAALEDESCAPTAAARIARDASFVLKNIFTICNVSCVRTKKVV